jgi:hypothetical protein
MTQLVHEREGMEGRNAIGALAQEAYSCCSKSSCGKYDNCKKLQPHVKAIPVRLTLLQLVKPLLHHLHELG